jgi:hypothetical protein
MTPAFSDYVVKPPPFELMAWLDAPFFHLYGVDEGDAIASFPPSPSCASRT